MRYKNKKLPSHSSIKLAKASTSGPAILSIFCKPSKTTWITWLSWQDNRAQRGATTPALITQSTCWLFPLIVKLVIAQAASFCVWNSLYNYCKIIIYNII